MVKNSPENPKTPDFIDKRTWLRLRAALTGLAETDRVPVGLGDSNEIAEGVSPSLGVATTRGELASGWLRFAWFGTEAAEHLAAEGEQPFSAEVSFQMETPQARLHGYLRFEELPGEKAEGFISAAGRALTNDLETAYAFSTFANKIGLSRIWGQINENAGSEVEQQFTGPLTIDEVYRITGALVGLAREGV